MNVIIILIILVLFSLLILYINNELTSIDYIIEQYKYIPKKYKNKVLLSIINTKTDMRFEEFLKSLLYQSERVDNIDINLPYNKDNHPIELMKKVLSIYKIGTDIYQPRNNIIPTLKRYGNKKTIIIFVKDNKKYNYYFVEKIMEILKKNEKITIVDNIDFDKTNFIALNLDYVNTNIIEKMTSYNSIKSYIGDIKVL
jgi:hypothetical protein